MSTRAFRIWCKGGEFISLLYSALAMVPIL